jgi:histidyl-tRNA synthetase
MKVESVRGMRDILPEEAPRWHKLEQEIRAAFALYGYGEIRVPLVERAELFSRGVGEETEVVEKQMYVFPDRKGLPLALRPEATASVVRAYIEHGLHATGDLAKLYYLGPMFRYEKPQLGRQRQFHQYGVEAIGSLDPALDAEVMDVAAYLMEKLGLDRKRLTLRLNTIGCRKDREPYREALRRHFLPQQADLCPDCRRRLEENPLRILDCKQPQCQSAIAAAPKSLDHVCEACREHFTQVQEFVQALGIRYTLDPTLVRGLDYYTRTVFELCAEDLGAQDALLGGGRYDDLVELLGGPPAPAVGFAGGMERLVLVLSGQGAPPGAAEPALEVYLVPIGSDAKREGAKLLASLRRHGISADTDYMGRSLRKAMQVAGRSARYAAILGPDELARGEIKLKDLASGEEKAIGLAQFTADPHTFIG